jgi:hypothetical protein
MKELINAILSQEKNITSQSKKQRKLRIAYVKKKTGKCSEVERLNVKVEIETYR